jgi:hypothetical protein
MGSFLVERRNNPKLVVGNNFCAMSEFGRYVYMLIVDVAEIHNLASWANVDK